MIEIKGLEEVENTLKTLQKNINKTNVDKLRLKNNKELFDEWHKKQRPDIFTTAGRNIKNPFPVRKKHDKDFRKKRKYNVEAKSFTQGVWTGASYYVLQKRTPVKDRTYKEKINADGITVELGGKNSKYYNITLGATDKLLEKYKEKLMEDFIKGVFNGK